MTHLSGLKHSGSLTEQRDPKFRDEDKKYKQFFLLKKIIIITTKLLIKRFKKPE